MKKIATIISVVILIFMTFFIYKESRIIRGSHELVETAQARLPLSADGIASISCVGMVEDGDEVLVWFLSDDGLDGYDYWAMAYHIVGEHSYTYDEWYRPSTYSQDIVNTLWNGEDRFLINDQDCVAVVYKDNHGTILFKDQIKEGSYPYPYTLNEINGKIDFIDASGESIP